MGDVLYSDCWANYELQHGRVLVFLPSGDVGRVLRCAAALPVGRIARSFANLLRRLRPCTAGFVVGNDRLGLLAVELCTPAAEEPAHHLMCLLSRSRSVAV